MKFLTADYYKDWDYKKHARFCTALYLGLYAFDMTVSYFIIKKVAKKVETANQPTKKYLTCYKDIQKILISEKSKIIHCMTNRTYYASFRTSAFGAEGF